MKRLALFSIFLFAVSSSVGCVYSPGYVNPHTGMPYGGRWTPVCGGPADPLGIGCAFMYGNPYNQVPNGYSYPNLGGWQAAGDPCCDNGMMMHGGMMHGGMMHGGPQPTFVQGSGCDGCHSNSPMPVPSTNSPMKPTPDPKGSKSQSASSGAMTMVHPPFAPPSGQRLQKTSHLPAVRAH